jgi:hypothetical protein
MRMCGRSLLRYAIFLFWYALIFVLVWEDVGGLQFLVGVNGGSYVYGLDGFSVWFLELTALLVPVSFLASLGGHSVSAEGVCAAFTLYRRVVV